MEKLDKLWSYYLWNVHYMINTLGYTWEFSTIGDYKLIHELEHYERDFYRNSNPYLHEYRKEHLKFAQELIYNGMYFPFYAELRYEDEVSTKYIVLGNHRFYSLKRYNDECIEVDKKFLFISYPSDKGNLKTDVISKDRDFNNHCYYEYNFYTDRVMCRELLNLSDSMVRMDSIGTEMSDYIFSIKRSTGIDVPVNDILNDEDMFLDFISNPYSVEGNVSKVHK